MSMLFFILGFSFGIITMSSMQIERTKETEKRINKDYIPKSKVYFRIKELETHSKNATDVKINTLGDTMRATAKELKRIMEG